MTVGIILLHWNNTDEIQKIIHQVLDWQVKDWHLCIVDNSGNFENSNKAVHVIRPKMNRGFAGGANLGMAWAKEQQVDCFCLLNSDVEITKSAIQSLVQKLRSDNTLFAISPRIAENSQTKDEFHIGGRDPSLHLNTRIKSGETDTLDYLPGTCLLFKTAVIEKIAYLDEDFFFSGEIADYCLRMTDAGLKFSTDDKTTIKHLASDELKLRSSLYIYYNFRNRFLLINKHHPDKKKVLINKWSKIIRRQMLGALLRFNFNKFSVLYAALSDGKRNNFGPSLRFHK